MLIYLLKVTVIWMIFLLLFEGLYKKSRWFNANRFFLVLALLTGIVLPMIPWSFPESPAREAVVNNWNVLSRISPAAEAHPETPARHAGWETILSGIYGGGLLVFFVIHIREVIGITRSVAYGSYENRNGHKIFTGNKPHAPYSFMNRVFIYRPGQYTSQELEYMIRHEQAHVRNKHWLDLLLLQFFCMVFWFHPLVYRYRHLLKLTHEYQADDFAAGDNHYGYGHFLLQQTLLKGVPSIAHSFHFSPIKNRINMLTQTKAMRSGWKYAIALPALFCCTFLMAQSHRPDARIRKGNITIYKGNTFEWGSEIIDTVPVLDPVSGEELVHVSRHSPGIVKVNQEKVFNESEVSIPARYRRSNMDFSDYLMKELKSRSKLIPGSVTRIQIRNAVIDKNGKMIYYDIMYLNADMSGLNMPGFSGNPALDPVIEEIIDRSGDWNPAMKNGKPVYSFIAGTTSVALKPLHFKARPLVNDSVIKRN